MADDHVEGEVDDDADLFFEILEEVTAPQTLATKFAKLRAEIGDMKRLPLEAHLIFMDIESELGIDRGMDSWNEFEARIPKPAFDAEGNQVFGSAAHIVEPDQVAELRRIERQMEKKSTTLNDYSRQLAIQAATHPALSDQVKDVIKEDGWSLTALGELAKVDPAVLSRFMRGEGITVETLDRLGKTLLLRLNPDRPGRYREGIVEDRRKKKPPK